MTQNKAFKQAVRRRMEHTGESYSTARMVLMQPVIESCAPEPKFKVGDQIRVVRVLDDITDKNLIGCTGTIMEVESLPHFESIQYQHNYDVSLNRGGGIITGPHYLNEQMLDGVEA